MREERPAGAGRSGRPSLVVAAAQRQRRWSRVDLGVDRIAVALVALGGTVLERRSRPHQRGEHDVRATWSRRSRRWSRTCSPPQPDVRCLGVGVAVPGRRARRRRAGALRAQPGLGRRAVHRAARRRGSACRSATGNDADLGVLAEHLRGAAVGATTTSPTSAAASASVAASWSAARPLRGAPGYAGEIGHIVVDANGPQCRCGNIGCWEIQGRREPAARPRAGRLPGGGPPAVAEVVVAAGAGDKRAEESLRVGGGLDRDRAARRRQRLQPRGDRARRLAGPDLGRRRAVGDRGAATAPP